MAARSSLTSAVGSVVVCAALLTSVHAGAPVAAAVTCGGDGGGDDTPFYPGKSASAVYDETFAQGPETPGLPAFTPQGLTTWNDWDGTGRPLLVLGAYRKGHPSRLFAIDPATGTSVGTVEVAESHLGGIAVAGRWLFVQHAATSGAESVRRYSLADLREKLAEGGTPVLEPAGENQQVYGADFMSAFRGSVWAGRYSNAGADKMYEYHVAGDGTLDRVGGAWEVPAKTQGVLVIGSRLVFATGVTDTRMWVYERERNLDAAPGRCFRSPSYGQNLTLVGDTVYHAFEGGSARYSMTAPHKIEHLHTAPLDKLRELVDP